MVPEWQRGEQRRGEHGLRTSQGILTSLGVDAKMEPEKKKEKKKKTTSYIKVWLDEFP